MEVTVLFREWGARMAWSDGDGQAGQPVAINGWTCHFRELQEQLRQGQAIFMSADRFP